MVIRSEYDLSVLEKCSNETLLTSFVHACVDEITGRPFVKYPDGNSEVEWTKTENEQAKNVIWKLYKTCALNNELPDDKLGNLPKNIQQIIKECYLVRKDHIYQEAMRQHISSGGRPLVENFDWKLKWLLGNSSMVNTSEPNLELDLYCKENEKLQIIQTQMTPEQLNSVLSELIRVKEELEKKMSVNTKLE